jgi:hypothetical protein
MVARDKGFEKQMRLARQKAAIRCVECSTPTTGHGLKRNLSKSGLETASRVAHHNDSHLILEAFQVSAGVAALGELNLVVRLYISI